jgi:hypothetical protein
MQVVAVQLSFIWGFLYIQETEVSVEFGIVLFTGLTYTQLERDKGRVVVMPLSVPYCFVTFWLHSVTMKPRTPFCTSHL